MDAIEILRAEHKALKGSMAEIVCSAAGDRRNLFAAFKRALDLHDAVERDVFYPLIGANPKTFGFQGMDTETRRAVAKAMRNLEALPVDSTDWFPYFKAIQGILGRQMDAEEFSVFERVRDALGPAELGELGRRMVYERQQRLSAAVRQAPVRAGSAPPRLPTRSMGGHPRPGSDGGSTTD